MLPEGTRKRELGFRSWHVIEKDFGFALARLDQRADVHHEAIVAAQVFGNIFFNLIKSEST